MGMMPLGTKPRTPHGCPQLRSAAVTSYGLRPTGPDGQVSDANESLCT